VRFDRQLVLGGLLALAGCAFDPLPAQPAQPGDPCTADRQCTSRLCVAPRAGLPGRCGACGEGLACAPGARCEVSIGACVPGVPGGPVHVERPGGARRESAEGRVHVGRVGVVPVTTEVTR
jgi:hypothetical protein